MRIFPCFPILQSTKHFSALCRIDRRRGILIPTAGQKRGFFSGRIHLIDRDRFILEKAAENIYSLHADCLGSSLGHPAYGTVDLPIAVLLIEDLRPEIFSVGDTGAVGFVEEEVLIADQLIFLHDRPHLLLTFLVCITADYTAGQVIDKRNPVFNIVEKQKSRNTDLVIADHQHDAFQYGGCKSCSDPVHHTHKYDIDQAHIHNLEIDGGRSKSRQIFRQDKHDGQIDHRTDQFTRCLHIASDPLFQRS